MGGICDARGGPDQRKTPMPPPLEIVGFLAGVAGLGAGAGVAARRVGVVVRVDVDRVVVARGAGAAATGAVHRTSGCRMMVRNSSTLGS